MPNVVASMRRCDNGFEDGSNELFMLLQAVREIADEFANTANRPGR